MAICDPNRWPGPRNAGLRMGFEENPHSGLRRRWPDWKLAVLIGLAVGAAISIMIMILR